MQYVCGLGFLGQSEYLLIPKNMVMMNGFVHVRERDLLISQVASAHGFQRKYIALALILLFFCDWDWDLFRQRSVTFSAFYYLRFIGENNIKQLLLIRILNIDNKAYNLGIFAALLFLSMNWGN